MLLDNTCLLVPSAPDFRSLSYNLESVSIKLLHIFFTYMFNIPKVFLKETLMFFLRDVSLLLRFVLIQRNAFWFYIDAQFDSEFKDAWFI